MVEDELQMKCMVDKKILEFVGVAGCGRNSSGTRMCLLTSHIQYAVSGGGGEILEGTTDGAQVCGCLTSIFQHS